MTPLVIGPSAETYRRHRVGGSAAVALWLGLCLQLYRLGFWGLGVGVVAGALAILGGWRYVTGLRVEVSDDVLTYRGLLRTRRWPLEQVGSVLRVERLSVSRIQPELTWLIPRRIGGRRLFQITSAVWPKESVDALTERLSRHAAVERVTEPVSAVEVGAAYRGALNPVQARPILFSVVLTTLLMAAVVLGTYLVVGR